MSSDGACVQTRTVAGVTTMATTMVAIAAVGFIMLSHAYLYTAGVPLTPDWQPARLQQMLCTSGHFVALPATCLLYLSTVLEPGGQLPEWALITLTYSSLATMTRGSSLAVE